MRKTGASGVTGDSEGLVLATNQSAAIVQFEEIRFQMVVVGLEQVEPWR